MVQYCLRVVAGFILLGAVLSSGLGGGGADPEPRSGMSAPLGLGQAHRQMENLSVRAWLQTESGLLDIGPEAPAEPIIRYAESRRDGGRVRLSLAAQDTPRPTDWPFYQELLLPTSADVEPTVQGFARMRDEQAGDMVAYCPYSGFEALGDSGRFALPPGNTRYLDVYAYVPAQMENPVDIPTLTRVRSTVVLPYGLRSVLTYEYLAEHTEAGLKATLTILHEFVLEGQTLARSEQVVGPMNGQIVMLPLHLGIGWPGPGRYTSQVVRQVEQLGMLMSSETLVDRSYVQRRLSFREPLEDMELSPGEPLEFQNEVAWLTDDPSAAPRFEPVLPGEEPRWTATVLDSAGEVLATASGGGTQVAFSFDPGDLGLARADGRPVRVRLASDSVQRVQQAQPTGDPLPEEEPAFDLTVCLETSARTYPNLSGEMRPTVPSASTEDPGFARYFERQEVALLDRVTLIEVLEPETGRRLATSNNDFPGIRDLLSRVYPANLQGRNQRINVRVVTPGRTGQETLDAKVRTSHTTPAGVDVRLQRVAGTNRFEGEVVLDGRLLQRKAMTATSLDIASTGLRDSEAFEKGMISRLGFQLMGRMWSSHIDPDAILSRRWGNMDGLLEQDNVPAKDPTTSDGGQQEAFQAAGYEVLQVDLPGVTGPGGAELAARMRVRNQASLIYYSGHGDGGRNKLILDNSTMGIHPGNYIGDPGEEGRQITLKPVHWQDNLRFLVIAGCSVLNINNYNRWWPEPHPDPGLVWDYVLGNPARRAQLFGYNQVAPTGPHTDTRIIEQFLSTSMEPLDWLEANARHDTYDSACAIDSGYYYFIKHRWRRTGETRKAGQYIRLLHFDRWFVRAPRSDWHLPDPDSHRVESLGNQLDDVRYWALPGNIPPVPDPPVAP